MAAGVPVVAVDAPGIREVVKDKVNGRLLSNENVEDFVLALKWVKSLSKKKLAILKKECKKTASSFSMEMGHVKVLEIYNKLSIHAGFCRKPTEESSWAAVGRLMQTQWGLVKNLTKSTIALIGIGSEKTDVNEVQMQLN